MIIRQAYRTSIDQLMTIYSASEATSIADWLMEFITGQKKTGWDHKYLDESQVTSLGEKLERLLKHEPLQYVLEEAWFSGLKFYVNKNVLIPRPETEELVEWIISNCRFPLRDLAILDIGTGSGCIAISLKRRLRKAGLTAIDISNDALVIARKNSDTLGADVNFQVMNVLDENETKQLPAFDIIVSNPPYVPEEDRQSMEPNVSGFEPGIALFVPDDDPMIFYRVIAKFGKTKLNDGGSIYAEIHADLGEQVSLTFINEGYTVELKNDMQGKQRMIRAQKKE